MAQAAGHDADGKVRVAVIGGGCAGIAAAWELSKDPRYQVHVFEKSWRLGGKGASGRTADGRIIEHGLHVWLGFYENAFKMIRDCYAAVAAEGWGPMSKDRRTVSVCGTRGVESRPSVSTSK